MAAAPSRSYVSWCMNEKAGDVVGSFLSLSPLCPPPRNEGRAVAQYTKQICWDDVARRRRRRRRRKQLRPRTGVGVRVGRAFLSRGSGSVTCCSILEFVWVKPLCRPNGADRRISSLLIHSRVFGNHGRGKSD